MRPLSYLKTKIVPAGIRPLTVLYGPFRQITLELSRETIIGEQSRESRSLFLAFFLTAGVMLMLLSAGQIIKYHEISKGIALFGAGVLALLTAAVLVFTAQFCALVARPFTLRAALVLVALVWLAWTGLIAYTHHVEGWDEGAYVLSGMALRGYQVPYAAHRAPVTGFLCAAFMGWDRFLNPVLLSLLLLVVYLWGRRLLGPLTAVLSLFVLLCQNILLESTVDIMSELPAALLLVVAFFCLARERFWWAALLFTLVVFTRWNLAPVWAVAFMAVLIRFGVRQALKFVVVGLAIFSGWYALTVAMGTPNPLHRVYVGNFLSAIAFTTDPGQKPDFLLRVKFYAEHFFFLTPPILFGLIASPIQNLRKPLRTELWVVLVVLPLALLAYIVTMLNMGALFPRFMTPLIPSAVLSLLCWLSTTANDYLLPELSRIRLVTIAVFLTCAVGLWPLSALVQARINYKTQAIFSAELRKELIALDRKVSLLGVPREPLSRANGHPTMVEVRHLILFPSAHRDFNYSIIEESDSIDCVRRLAAACHAGDLLIIPKKYASDFASEAILFSDEHWAVVRKK